MNRQLTKDEPMTDEPMTDDPVPDDPAPDGIDDPAPDGIDGIDDDSPRAVAHRLLDAVLDLGGHLARLTAEAAEDAYYQRTLITERLPPGKQAAEGGAWGEFVRINLTPYCDFHLVDLVVIGPTGTKISHAYAGDTVLFRLNEPVTIDVFNGLSFLREVLRGGFVCGGVPIVIGLQLPDEPPVDFDKPLVVLITGRRPKRRVDPVAEGAFLRRVYGWVRGVASVFGA